MHTLTIPTTDANGRSNWVRLSPQPLKIFTLKTPAVLEATSAKVLFEGSDNKDAAGYYEIRDQAGDRVEVAVRTATAPADGDVDSLEKSDIDGHWFCTVI